MCNRYWKPHRYFRKLKGWSQETLALQAEINPAFLGHLERGLKSPTVKTLEKIACALDISMAELFAEPETSQWRERCHIDGTA